MTQERTAFVFDADGVICTGERFDLALQRRYGIPPDVVAEFFSTRFCDCLLGRQDLKTAIAPYAAWWGWRESIDDLLCFWFGSENVICAQTLACVRSLRARGHICVLGTNQEKYRAAYLRVTMRLADEFDRVFVSCELDSVKPSGKFFAEIERALGKRPVDLCLVDDTRKNVVAAEAAGWRGVLYGSPADLPLLAAISVTEAM